MARQHLEEIGPAFYCVAQTLRPAAAQPPHHQAGRMKQPAAPGETPSGPLTEASADALIGYTAQRHKRVPIKLNERETSQLS